MAQGHPRDPPFGEGGSEATAQGWSRPCLIRPVHHLLPSPWPDQPCTPCRGFPAKGKCAAESRGRMCVGGAERPSAPSQLSRTAIPPPICVGSTTAPCSSGASCCLWRGPGVPTDARVRRQQGQCERSLDVPQETQPSLHREHLGKGPRAHCPRPHAASPCLRGGCGGERRVGAERCWHLPRHRSTFESVTPVVTQLVFCFFLRTCFSLNLLFRKLKIHMKLGETMQRDPMCPLPAFPHLPHHTQGRWARDRLTIGCIHSLSRPQAM